MCGERGGMWMMHAYTHKIFLHSHNQSMLLAKRQTGTVTSFGVGIGIRVMHI